jgi:hypothetical protein
MSLSTAKPQKRSFLEEMIKEGEVNADETASQSTCCTAPLSLSGLKMVTLWWHIGRIERHYCCILLRCIVILC